MDKNKLTSKKSLKIGLSGLALAGIFAGLTVGFQNCGPGASPPASPLVESSAKNVVRAPTSIPEVEIAAPVVEKTEAELSEARQAQLGNYLAKPEVSAWMNDLKDSLGENTPPAILGLLASNRNAAKSSSDDIAISQNALQEITRNPDAALPALGDLLVRLKDKPEMEVERQMIFEVAASLTGSADQRTPKNAALLKEMQSSL